MEINKQILASKLAGELAEALAGGYFATAHMLAERIAKITYQMWEETKP